MKAFKECTAIAALSTITLANDVPPSRRFPPFGVAGNEGDLSKRQQDENPYTVYSVQQPVCLSSSGALFNAPPLDQKFTH